MRGERDAIEPPDIVDGFARFALPDPEQGSAASNARVCFDRPSTALTGGGLELVEILTIRFGPCPPLGVKIVEPDLFLRLARREERHAAHGLPFVAMFRGMGVDLLGALRIIADKLSGHALDLEQSGARIECEFMTDLAHIMGKLVAIDLPRDDLLGIHRARLEADHAITFQVVGHIENDDMGMELGVEFAARIFGEAREQQPPGRLVDDLTSTRRRSWACSSR